MDVQAWNYGRKGGLARARTAERNSNGRFRKSRYFMCNQCGNRAQSKMIREEIDDHEIHWTCTVCGHTQTIYYNIQIRVTKKGD